MAVLNRDDFFSAIQSIIKDDTSDDSISFVENMTDTYNSLVNSASGDGEDWKKKYEENDKMWKERYKHRFFSGKNDFVPSGSENSEQEDKEAEAQERAEHITIDNLFSDTKDKTGKEVH